MDRTSPEVLREVERVLEKKLSTLSSVDYCAAGGVESVVEILNLVDRSSEKHIIETLEVENPKLAQEIVKTLRKPSRRSFPLSGNLKRPAKSISPGPMKTNWLFNHLGYLYVTRSCALFLLDAALTASTCPCNLPTLTRATAL